MHDSTLCFHQFQRLPLRVPIISFSSSSSLNFNSTQPLISITSNGEEEEDKELRESRAS